MENENVCCSCSLLDSAYDLHREAAVSEAGSGAGSRIDRRMLNSLCAYTPQDRAHPKLTSTWVYPVKRELVHYTKDTSHFRSGQDN